MKPKLILFQASLSSSHRRDNYKEDQRQFARETSRHLGGKLIEAGFGLILNSGRELDGEFGETAVLACHDLRLDPRSRIRTYPYGTKDNTGYGMVLAPDAKRWQDVRTFIVEECDAIVAIAGGKGTSDAIQKTKLAKKPVFPIASIPGGAKDEWENLRRENYKNLTDGDLDFLGDLTLGPEELADRIVSDCSRLLTPATRKCSKRVFIVHGHDAGPKLELARLLERLSLVPVILHEQVDAGRTIFQKLREELSDVGFAFILLTPDDVGCIAGSEELRPRARQNVVFEHGLLVGLLGPDRVCAIVKDEVEIPSDLQGILYKHLPRNGDLTSITLQLAAELNSAGLEIDAQALLRGV